MKYHVWGSSVFAASTTGAAHIEALVYEKEEAPTTAAKKGGKKRKLE